ncbi:hypothetical protein [Streptomyces sp. NPDC046197]|uniref:hypothetical protein n=1 Tax=Streptomyces sp. NPDC046197 TaxID=3154337 RepID=UPI0033CEC7B2
MSGKRAEAGGGGGAMGSVPRSPGRRKSHGRLRTGVSAAARYTSPTASEAVPSARGG